MEKDDLVKHMHFNLKFFNLRDSMLFGMPSSYKKILK